MFAICLNAAATIILAKHIQAVQRCPYFCGQKRRSRHDLFLKYYAICSYLLRDTVENHGKYPSVQPISRLRRDSDIIRAGPLRGPERSGPLPRFEAPNHKKLRYMKKTGTKM
jgi:hypothetical protein